MPQLNWYLKDNNNHYYELNRVDLSHTDYDEFKGVYIIWYITASNTSTMVYVGQGNIRERIAAHRLDSRIQNYSNYTLFVTWAQVYLEPDRLGIEKYLHDKFNPLEGEPPPGVNPIRANTPWD
jgi:hypothetical protein